MIRALLFDKDGTLMDSFGHWLRLELVLCQALGATPRHGDQMLKAIGIQGQRIDPKGLLASGTEDAILRALFDASGSQESFLRFCGRAQSILAAHGRGHPGPPGFPDASRVLTRLHSGGFPLGIATSDSWKHTCREVATQGWAPLFSQVLTGDRAPFPKPHPWMVQEFSRRTKVPVDQILVVGDSPADEAMARAAGAPFCAITTGVAGRTDFRGPDLVIDQLGDLEDWVWAQGREGSPAPNRIIGAPGP